ncbi:hypothetical protein SAMN05444354_103263 [Stigmatella aurantiaca]|uniref:Transcriptional regulator, AbiEi antitoxin, Type IV TA system n=1 Tax=Stigmatella aurantiaca TaxID=41 RepID=A0A1H7LK65_STIAU|nr:hypothetical protein [Stigmatella aurantiaca]SEK99311.1 hypothetical protein SAMN05444354_103263 [Stigmatella aurantiaca]
MAAMALPPLEQGRVYRTQDFELWSSNPSRFAADLVEKGVLVQVTHGLFACPKRSKFGVVPPGDDALMRAFLKGSPFVFTGPERWNALGLGATAVFAAPLVYNTKRSGTVDLGGRLFELRRVAFPQAPSQEWFVVDLLENADRAGTSRTELAGALVRALARGSFDRERLREMAQRYGTKATRDWVYSALRASAV